MPLSRVFSSQSCLLYWSMNQLCQVRVLLTNFVRVGHKNEARFTLFCRFILLLIRIPVARVLSVCTAGISEDHVCLWSHGCFLVISLCSASAGMPKSFASCLVFVQAELSAVPKN